MPLKKNNESQGHGSVIVHLAFAVRHLEEVTRKRRIRKQLQKLGSLRHISASLTKQMLCSFARRANSLFRRKDSRTVQTGEYQTSLRRAIANVASRMTKDGLTKVWVC
jgi:hypothetical protein